MGVAVHTARITEEREYLDISAYTWGRLGSKEAGQISVRRLRMSALSRHHNVQSSCALKFPPEVKFLRGKAAIATTEILVFL